VQGFLLEQFVGVVSSVALQMIGHLVEMPRRRLVELDRLTLARHGAFQRPPTRVARLGRGHA
jgi:hypothetical protein